MQDKHAKWHCYYATNMLESTANLIIVFEET